MADLHPLGDLAPRDVVSRAIARHLRSVGADNVWLDATMIDEFPDRFPTIWNACQDAGLDPTTDWLPVAPAAHYMSGGVVADLDGATTLAHLWACGETSCSGVHGANRLASNSLLDGLVFGRRVVDAIAGGKSEADPTGVMASVLDRSFAGAATDPVVLPKKHTTDPAALRGSIQRVMTQDCGVLREANGLRLASETLADLASLAEDLPSRQPGTYEAMNLARVARAIVASATAREESRGSHTRTDYADTSDEFSGRFFITGDAAPQFAPLSQPAVGKGAR
jgi:L-aspartate oxidase